MRIVVGFQDTKEGRDALACAARLAHSGGDELHVVLVLADNTRPTLAPPEVGFTRYLVNAAHEWLDNARTWLTTHGYGDLATTTHLRYAESDVEGVLDLVSEIDADLVVIGPPGSRWSQRVRLSGMASALLHASTVAVVLAPRRGRKLEAGGMTRVTAALGARPGASDVLRAGVRFAQDWQVPLRLLSLVAVDEHALADDPAAAQAAASSQVARVLAEAHATLPSELAATTEVGTGNRLEDAARNIDWAPTELLVVGSARLAQHGRLFFGSSAAHILRSLPVAMMVIPRDLEAHQHGAEVSA